MKFFTTLFQEARNTEKNCFRSNPMTDYGGNHFSEILTKTQEVEKKKKE